MIQTASGFDDFSRVVFKSKIDPSKLAAGVILQGRRLCRLRRETAFSPESTAGSSEARFNGRPFCVSRDRRRS